VRDPGPDLGRRLARVRFLDREACMALNPRGGAWLEIEYWVLTGSKL
jgi:hypothetical protein